MDMRGNNDDRDDNDGLKTRKETNAIEMEEKMIQEEDGGILWSLIHCEKMRF